MAVSDTLLRASRFMLVAQLMAVAELVRRQSLGARPAPGPAPEHDRHHI